VAPQNLHYGIEKVGEQHGKQKHQNDPPSAVDGDADCRQQSSRQQNVDGTSFGECHDSVIHGRQAESWCSSYQQVPGLQNERFRKRFWGNITSMPTDAEGVLNALGRRNTAANLDGLAAFATG
jgi:hypothetical protein